MAVVVQWGYYLDRYPMGNYSCPSYCDVHHIHYSQEKLDFMEYLVKGDTILVSYEHLGKKIEIEWVRSY